MLTSLFTGLSGIDANGTALTVIGNNIANVNTVGFKGSDVTFEDVLGAAIPAVQFGAGVTVGSITAAFTQGAFESTESATDLAISGNGFFVVSDGTKQLFTRAGHFIFDAQGNLVTPQGQAVQGWLADQTGAIATTGQPTNLTLGTAVSPPSATTSFNLGMNLDANGTTPMAATAGQETFVGVADQAANLAAGNFTITSTATQGTPPAPIFTAEIAIPAPLPGPPPTGMSLQGLRDAINANAVLGPNVTATIVDTGVVGPNRFQLQIKADATGTQSDFNATSTSTSLTRSTDTLLTFAAQNEGVVGETFSTSFDVFDSKGGKVTLTVAFAFNPDTNQWDWTADSSDGTTTDTGSLQFDLNGRLTPPAGGEPTITIADLTDGAATLKLNWDMLDDTGASNGLVTSFVSPSVVNSRTEDGFDSGILQGVSVDDTGVISGVFSNGQNRDLGQVALADFRSPWQLVTVGGGLFAASQGSGEPAIGLASSGGRGSISSATLEGSNVDLSREFVKMITAQRGFQASSRVITTTDALLDEVVNLKR